MNKKELIEIYGGKQADWKRHKNTDGSKGGWVSKCSEVSKCSYICELSVVKNNSRVYNSRVSNSIVDNSRVSSSSVSSSSVYDSSRVSSSSVYDSRVYDSSRVSNNSRVYNSIVDNSSIVDNNSRVSNSSVYDSIVENVQLVSITGTQHGVHWRDGEHIAIGCEVHTLEHWLENYAEIGKNNGYSDDQIEEYKRYIDIMAVSPRPVTNEATQ